MYDAYFLNYDELIYELNQISIKINYQFNIIKKNGYLEYELFNNRNLGEYYSSLYLLDIEEKIMEIYKKSFDTLLD